MRISDWSSDVCPSDLFDVFVTFPPSPPAPAAGRPRAWRLQPCAATAGLRADGRAAPPHRRARRGAAFASRPAGDAHLALRRRLARADDPRAPGRGGLRAPQERAAAADHHPLARHPHRQRHGRRAAPDPARVEPGGTFDYRFTVPDAGTFWYHPHERSWEQVARGLYGLLIVEEQEPAEGVRDFAIVADDWRLGEDGQLEEASLGNMMDWSQIGRASGRERVCQNG